MTLDPKLRFASRDALNCRAKRATRAARAGDGVRTNHPIHQSELAFVQRNIGRLTEVEMARCLGRTYYGIVSIKRKLKKEKVMGAGPLKLKQTLEKKNVGLREFARLIHEPATNVFNLVNRGEFTKKAEKNGIRKKIVGALKELGVHDRELLTVFMPLNTPEVGRPLDKNVTFLEGEMITQETLDFYGMAEDPFESLKGPADIYRTAGYKRTKKIVEKAISRRGFVAVWGDVGSGKTTLWREVEAGLGDKYRVIRPVILEKERLTVYNLQEAIITDLKARREDYTTGMRSSKEARDRQIRDLLLLYDSEGIGCVLIIEEAHTLPLRTLKALKRLHEIQHGFSAPLSIVLLGQPELKHDLWDDLRIREVTRRCRLVELPRLRASELGAYILHRFTRAGEKPNQITAEGQKAIEDIWKNGVAPLQLNNFTSFLLNQAAEVGKKKISADMVYGMVAKKV